MDGCVDENCRSPPPPPTIGRVPAARNSIGFLIPFPPALMFPLLFSW